MKKIFSIIILGTSLFHCQQKNNDCPDEKKFFIRNNVSFNKKINISEYVERDTEKRFIVIKDGSKCFVNYNTLLSTEDVEGYATNFIKTNPNGFYYSFEYGNRYHYEYQVYFKYLKDNFYVYKVIQKFSDLANPNSLSSKNYSPKKIKFNQFDIHNFLPK